MKIGQKLFQALLSDCINNDMQSLLVWVVTNNPSKSFMKNSTLKKLIRNFRESKGRRNSVLLERFEFVTKQTAI